MSGGTDARGGRTNDRTVGGVIGAVVVVLMVAWFLASAAAGVPIERSKREQEKRNRELAGRKGD